MLIINALSWSIYSIYEVWSALRTISSYPATLHNVVSFAIGYAGMGNPKAALESMVVAVSKTRWNPWVHKVDLPQYNITRQART